jgi:GTPase SAR1 family protein
MTLENLGQWVNICRKSDKSLPILFLGTKLDLVNDIMVQDDYAQSFQEEFALFDYMKISSKSGENVSQAFEVLTNKILERQTY